MSLLLLFSRGGVGFLSDAVSVPQVVGSKGGAIIRAAGPGTFVGTKAGATMVAVPAMTTSVPPYAQVIGSKGGARAVPVGAPLYFQGSKGGAVPVYSYAPTTYGGQPAPVTQAASLPLLLGAYLRAPPAPAKPLFRPAGVSTSPFWRGILAATTPRATAALTGTVTQAFQGTIAVTTPGATAAIQGRHGVSATIGATAPRATASISGQVGDFAGQIAATTPGAVISISGNAGVFTVSGVIAATAPQATMLAFLSPGHVVAEQSAVALASVATSATGFAVAEQSAVALASVATSAG